MGYAKSPEDRVHQEIFVRGNSSLEPDVLGI